jgi:hypothetical protein
MPTSMTIALLRAKPAGRALGVSTGQPKWVYFVSQRIYEDGVPKFRGLGASDILALLAEAA